MNENDWAQAVREFVGAFEVVFRYDWDNTKVMIGDEGEGGEGANFIEPQLEDETEDWGARGALLEKFRNLMAVMKANSLEPQFPFPLEHLPSFKRRAW